jgi:hypothetical protein
MAGGWNVDLALAGVRKAVGFQNVWLSFGLDDQKVMFVRMDEVSGAHVAPDNFRRAASTDRMHMEVSGALALSESLEVSVGADTPALYGRRSAGARCPDRP